MDSNLNCLDYRYVQNIPVEKKQSQRTQSLHRNRIDNAQSLYNNTQVVQRQMSKQENLLQNLQNTHYLDNIKLQQKNDQFLSNLKNIMNKKNMFANGQLEKNQEKYDEQLYAREKHTYTLKKQKLKEISYQNLNILNRIRNVKSNINNDKNEKDYAYQKGYSKHSSRYGKRIFNYKKNKDNDTSNANSRFNLTENNQNQSKRPFSLNKIPSQINNNQSTSDQIILFQGNIQIKQQLYKVKLHKKKTLFQVEFLLLQEQQQGNTSIKQHSIKENKQQTIEISDVVGFQLMSEHDYKYEKICGFIIYKHLFRNEKFDNELDTTSTKFNRIIKTEFRNSQRKQYHFNKLHTQQQIRTQNEHEEDSKINDFETQNQMNEITKEEDFEESGQKKVKSIENLHTYG